MLMNTKSSMGGHSHISPTFRAFSILSSRSKWKKLSKIKMVAIFVSGVSFRVQSIKNNMAALFHRHSRFYILKIHFLGFDDHTEYFWSCFDQLQ